jgi:4-amino-4-deoxy-L-arabinose transferase-like glycosyltransferase
MAKEVKGTVNVRRLFLPLLLAAGCTALNACKAPLIDDTAYLTLARYIAQHPLDPYGFKQFWYQWPQPANQVLAPPVQPYWLALGMRICGNEPVAWKLWLFPEMLLLAIALRVLFRRFARGVEAPLLVLAMLSPAMLPAWNFMLDLPAMALSVSALVLFLRAFERKSLVGALAAGVVAGLAAQTKYTGLLMPPVLVAAALFSPIRCRKSGPTLPWRILFAALACTAAALVFTGWETFVRWKYGESHFLYALGPSPESWQEKLDFYLAKWRLLLPMLILLGGLLPPAAIIGYAGLLRDRRWLFIPVALLIAAYTALIVVPVRESAWSGTEAPFASWILGTLGGSSILVLMLAVFRQLFRLYACRAPVWKRWWTRLRLSPAVWFLSFWLLIEMAGFLAMTPFPASRRLFGFTLVATVIAGRLVSRTCRRRERKKTVWFAVVPGIALGLFFAVIDVADSWREPTAVRATARLIRQEDPTATIWFVGHWGFQFEAERQGMKPLIPMNPYYPECSLLQPGDWLIVPNGESVDQQEFVPADAMGEPVARVIIRRRFPLRTLPAYYGGYLPIERGPDPQIEVAIYRISEKWTPRWR